MIKKFLLSFTASVFAVFVYSQSGCPGCNIDNSCFKTKEVTICPQALPDACYNEPYSEDLTFYVPKDLIFEGNSISLGSIQLISITNMPAGLDWELNNPSGLYNVTAPEIRGCIKICGTPTTFGTFFITVTVNANVTSPISTSKMQSFSLPLVVKNCGGGNPFFSYNTNQGCDTLSVQYEGLYEAQLPKQTEFEWDFGDGTTGTGKKPAPVFYSQPDTYYVSLNTKFYDLTLDSVTAIVSGDWWCGDIEEPKLFGACTGQPDPQFFFTSGSASIKGDYRDNTMNGKWKASELLQNGEPFRIKEVGNVIRFEDYDPTSANDDGGAAAIVIDKPGVYTYATVSPYGGGVSGNIYIGEILDTVFSYTDTVIVYPLPPETEIAYIPDTVFCGNQDIVLSVYDGYRYTWIKNDTSVIPLEVKSSYTIAANPYIVLDTISTIRVEISDTLTGCIRKTENIQVRQKPPIPGFITIQGIYQLNATTLVAESGKPYTYQWLLDGFPIAGATSSTFEPPVNGNYSCVFTNPSGCSDTSNVVAFVISGIGEVKDFSNLVQVMPNPSNGSLTLYVASAEAETMEVAIYNNMGQQVRKEIINRTGNGFKQFFELNELAAGNYVFHLNLAGKSATKRFILIK